MKGDFRDNLSGLLKTLYQNMRVLKPTFFSTAYLREDLRFGLCNVHFLKRSAQRKICAWHPSKATQQATTPVASQKQVEGAEPGKTA